MIKTVALASLVAASSASNYGSEAHMRLRAGKSSRQDIEYLFEEWRRQFEMEFESVEEHIKRLNIFAANHVRILEHNKSDASYTMGHNQFSHLTPDEFVAQNIRGLTSEPLDELKGTTHEFDLDVSAAPDSIDWTQQGAVTSVKNQGQCGSCWSFSTTGALEGRYFLKTGKLHTLSEQELVDCDTTDSGCNGGLMDYAFGYVEKNGLSSESAYGYKGTEDTCSSDSHSRDLPAGALKGYTDVPRSDEDALKAAVATGPVSVAIEADESAFQFYSGGVMTGSCGRNLDHGVLAVGYGNEPSSGGVDYWKVKNSWGPSWGEGGYIRIERGTSKCGIADQASYPTF